MSRQKQVVFHIVCWLLLFFKNITLELTGSGFVLNAGRFMSLLRSREGWITVGYFSMNMVAFYASYIALRQILLRRRVLYSLGIVILLFAVVTGWRALLEFGIFKPLLHFDNYINNPVFSWKYFVPNALLYYWIYMVSGAGWALYIHWQQAEKAVREREAMDRSMRLQFLQSQINPHFLFNSINDIYALVLRKSDKAAEALLQLSGLLRYALYDTRSTLVPLTMELKYIKDYIDLQRTGYENDFYVETGIDDDTHNWEIPPMLLLPFVENACKHGITRDPQRPVQLHIQTHQDRLCLRICNHKRRGEKDGTGGIGISNIRKRLELLYPTQHSLQIDEDHDTFIVQLQIRR